MSSLQAFLNPIQVENREVIVSKRFQENGEPVPFVIRPITQEENKGLMGKHNKRDKRGAETFDRAEYIASLTSAAVVFPDLKNAELQKGYGVMGESALLQKMLYAGEFAELAQAVQKLSGLEDDPNETINEVKNG
ncbi:MAG: phage portal protein [Desulfitobacterium sp.]